jgi:hypothetical protein
MINLLEWANERHIVVVRRNILSSLKYSQRFLHPNRVNPGEQPAAARQSRRVQV